MADAHVQALTRGVLGRRYILGGTHLSFQAFLALVADITQSPFEAKVSDYAHYYYQALLAEQGVAPSPGVDAYRMRVFKHHCYFDASLARRDLGYESGDIRLALQRAYDWYRQEGFLSARPG